MSQEKLFQCPECGHHYRKVELAKECEAFCKTYNACSLEISMKSVEYELTQQGAADES